MSDLNLEWVEENFSGDKMIFFNIGCADITDDTFRFTIALPKATVYSFECSHIWKESNAKKSKLFGFNYEHRAVSYYDGKANFYSGSFTASHIEDPWQYRGRLIDPRIQNDSRNWQQEDVEVITLNTFCHDKKIIPDFLHIDAESEEYNILRNLDENFLPKAIWLEHWPEYHDGIGDTVSFDILDKFLVTKGYKKLFQGADALYVRKDQKVTKYKEYLHYTSHGTEISQHEKIIQKKM